MDAIISPRMIHMATGGPTGSINWPITQATTIPPRLAPTKNQPVILPLICNRFSASDNAVGKIEAIDKPNNIAPNQKIRFDSGRRTIAVTLIKQPIKSIHTTVFELNLAVMGTPSSLPRVNAPQNADVINAAVVSPARFWRVAYVKAQLPKLASAPT